MTGVLRTAPNDILEQAAAWRAAGVPVALATVVETWGSSPRPVGAAMVVNGHGAFAGSVSGGCIEGDVTAAAQSVLASGRPQLLAFGVSDAMAWEAVLACGGRIRILVAPIDPEAAPFRALRRCRRARRSAVLVTDVESGDVWFWTPRRAGDDGDEGGDGAMRPLPLPQETLQAAAERDRSVLWDHDGRSVFVQTFTPSLRLFIVGAVHIAQFLAPLAQTVGYGVTVADPRRAWATTARFPQCVLDSRWPDEALRAWEPDHRSAVVALSHDPKLDDPALAVALESDVFYIGALGGAASNAARRMRLREEGIAEAALQRIAAPIGLDLGARAPEEIAVAILAQMILTLRGPRWGGGA